MKNGKYTETSVEYWYQNGILHKEDGPAVIYQDGTQRWYINGKLHRLDGPASIDDNNTQEWFKMGKRHREDGPAYISSCGGYQFYYLDDVLLDKSEWSIKMSLKQLI